MTSTRSIFTAMLAAAAVCLTTSVAFAQYDPPGPPPGQPPAGQGASAPPPSYAPPPPGYAQPPPPPPPSGTYRDGLMFGGSLGVGSLKFTDSNNSQNSVSFAGGSGGLFVGLMISPTFAILVDAWGVTHGNSDSSSLTTFVGTIAGRVFLGSSLWLEAGVGFGNSQFKFASGATVQSDTGGAFQAGVGLEVWHTGNFAIDVNLRGGLAKVGSHTYSSIGALSVGINWY